MKILVVDDVEDNVELMRRWLTRRGHDVVTARDGRAAIDATGRERPDLIFMDIGMPGMSGVDAIRAIRAGEAIAATPIVALTAHAMASERREYLAAGADDVATKPVDFQVLTAVIAAFAARQGA